MRPRRIPPPPPLAQLNKRFAFFDESSRCHVYRRHPPGNGCLDWHFHLHGFEDGHGLALLDLIVERHFEFPDRTGYMRTNRSDRWASILACC